MIDCEPCADYLAANRDRLLPHVGRWVSRQEWATPPAALVRRLLREFHRRNHTT